MNNALKEKIVKEVWDLIYNRKIGTDDKMSCFENLPNDLKFEMAWDKVNFVIFDLACWLASGAAKYKMIFTEHDQHYKAYCLGVDNLIKQRGHW